MKPYLQLIKMNITILVVITSYLGYYLGLRYENLMMIEYEGWIVFLYLVVGTFISSSGACILNQYFEVEYDKKMERTKFRPLPTKEIDLNVALILGVLLSFLGPFILLQINPLTSLISFLTIFIYIVIYTPLKRFSSINTIVGAVPGALPPLGGWVAATNQINLEGMLLFGILFCWQIPHFLSLAYMYASDYKKGGFVMLPSLYSNQVKTRVHTIFFTLCLVSITFSLYFNKLAGNIYLLGNLVLSLIFIRYVYRFTLLVNKETARGVFLASIFYLPALLFLVLINF